MGPPKMIFDRIRFFWVFLALIFLGPNLASAFLSEEAVGERENLVETTVKMGDCPDPNRLSHLIAVGGLRSLDLPHRELIIKNFTSFNSIIAESQKPPYRPNLFTHDFYLSHTTNSQRTEMVAALRTWLTADIKEVRTGGSFGPSGRKSDEIKADIAEQNAKLIEINEKLKAVEAEFYPTNRLYLCY